MEVLILDVVDHVLDYAMVLVILDAQDVVLVVVIVIHHVEMDVKDALVVVILLALGVVAAPVVAKEDVVLDVKVLALLDARMDVLDV